MNLTIDALDWDERSDALINALGGIDATPVKTAVRRAVTKTAKWLRVRIVRAIAQGIQMPVRALDQLRVRIHYNKARDGGAVDMWEALLWVGTNPVSAQRFGAVSWRRSMSGARAGRRIFGGTFAAAPRGGEKIVWRRMGKERLPIEKETVAIDEVAQENGLRLERMGLQRFRDTLAHELDYELSKALK
jgi:hypothetical protein